jgi:hypothetical protein
MNPIYKFELSALGNTQRAYPVYKDDLSKEFEKESGQEFFRAKLSGKLTFQRDDYVFIVSKAFDTQFTLEIYISYDAGSSWALYWTGTFWKTDCDFDEDSQTVIVQPTVKDQYNDVLAGLEKEFNLIDLAPEIAVIKADKRPMVQVYIPGTSTVGCFLAGMSWEQECEPVIDGDILVNTYYFALSKGFTYIRINGQMTPQLPDEVSGTVNAQSGKYFNFTVGDFRYTRTRDTNFDVISVYNTVTGVWWRNERVNPDLTGNYTIGVYPVSGSGATGDVMLDIETIDVYCRYVLDVESIMNRDTYLIPDDDIVENNRNYRRVIGYEFPDCVFFSTSLSSTPTKWGAYRPGKYYQKPAGESYFGEFFPVSRREWVRASVWFAFYAFDQQIEESGRKAYAIKNNYPLWSVISVLLGQIAPDITHEATTEYSEFLYSPVDPIASVAQKLFLTPKSNILTANYDQPAQKAPITLHKVLDMLRDCFRLYWFIDDQNRFRIEHITWFMRGGSYSPPEENTTYDLTQEVVSRNDKPWAFARGQYRFDKPAMVERYEFGWMDEVTDLFEGFPIDITSKYVTPGNIQQTKVNQFTSDIDYMLLNPGACSKDGFALLAGIDKNELSAPETYTLHGNDYVPFREPVPDEWKGTDAKMRFTLSSGHTFFRVYLTDGNYNQYDFDAGITETVIPIPMNTRVFYLYGTEGQTVEFTFVGIGAFAIPYGNVRTEYSNHVLQNFFCSFVFLENNYYVFDMPASHYRINGINMIALGTKKLKTQGIRFPLLYDINLNQLIRTTLGDGTIDKLSINLSSRSANATLKYDTE